MSQKYAILMGVDAISLPFGAKVERRRNDLGLSQRLAAKRAGISDAGWRRIERETNTGPPQAKTVLGIARVLGWDPTETLKLAGLDGSGDMGTLQLTANPRDEMDKYWPSLSDPQRWSLVYSAATMVTPRQWPELDQMARPERDARDDVVILDISPEETDRERHEDTISDGD